MCGDCFVVYIGRPYKSFRPRRYRGAAGVISILLSSLVKRIHHNFREVAVIVRHVHMRLYYRDESIYLWTEIQLDLNSAEYERDNNFKKSLIFDVIDFILN